MQVAGEVDPDALLAGAGGGEHVHQHPPVIGPQADLLGEFALCGGEVVLPVDVEQTGRRFDQAQAGGVAVLADQDHPVGVVERDDADRARVADPLPPQVGTGRIHHLVADEVEHRPLADQMAGADRPGHRDVAQLGRIKGAARGGIERAACGRGETVGGGGAVGHLRPRPRPAVGRCPGAAARPGPGRRTAGAGGSAAT
ncbi:hypothetical protein SDC9_117447 [bioreactor metagenome]|uniref:Uncharacterized protein n=1 Tax=bioreactor metagenome TaxID=1076179 RepID=A0A645BYS2_9ZZZZ